VGSDAGCGVSVLVADGDSESRAVVVALLERIGATPYEAATGTEALTLAESALPALVILDIALPGISGYEVCHQLRDRYGDALSLVFVSATRGEPLDRVAGFLLGADDYVVKPFDPDELLVRIRALLRRQDGRQNGRDEQDGQADPLATLTSREQEVLALLAQGRNQNEIALELVISSKTVATHIQRILAKFGVPSRAQAVSLAYREGLVEQDVRAHALVSDGSAD
jgi:DNA-binding NarL/FixJ family response regulator